MVPYLQSLEVLPNLDVKLLVVPPWVRPIPYTRVNHAKYIVTDKVRCMPQSDCHDRDGDPITRFRFVHVHCDSCHAMLIVIRMLR